MARGLASPRAALALAALLTVACRAVPPSHPAPPAGAALDPARLHVVMVNGGGRRAQNFQSHLLHVRQLLDLLLQAGVPRAQVAIFSSDGADPAEDLAVREVQPEADFDLLRGTSLERALRTPLAFRNSAVPGMELRPATATALTAWFEGAGRRLRPGHTLLLYVTDHGTRNPDDLADNLITLWGDKESLSVRELRALLERLDPGVRVVTLMSQCFSGSFAHLIHTHATDGVPPGRVCGYFASTADRPAYGCYPENRGRENVGHSFQFFQALAATPRFADAHRAVLVADATPDVPIASSDTYLDELLHEAAAAAGEEPMALVDDLLRAAWRDKAAWEHEIRLLDRIGQTFGIFSPRSLAELEDQAARLPEVSDRFRTYGRAWSAALDDLRQANLDRFLAAHPRWAERLAPPALEALDATQRRRLTRELLDALAPFTRADAHTTGRLDVLHEKAQAATAAAYRMEVRLGVVLRMRAVLASVAGRVLLARGERPAAAAAHAALRACEDLGLDTDGKLASPGSLADAAPFPALDEDIETAGHVLPAWMGIRFRAASPPERRRHGLPDGAAVVLAVYPDSPAEDAGFAVGDFVLGPAGTPFTEPHQIREWTMLSPIGEPAPLDVLRASSPLRLALVPEPYPLAWPELPGPPKVGSPAPALALAAYRGAPPSRLDDGTPRLLFFWATWCLPCKAALPEVLAFSRERATPVVAITDELPEQLDAFFRDFHDPFPPVVAVDEYRRTFLAYGVSGTPTFVLIDGAGKVQGQSGGYRPDVGLGLAGWSWARRGAAP